MLCSGRDLMLCQQTRLCSRSCTVACWLPASAYVPRQDFVSSSSSNMTKRKSPAHACLPCQVLCQVCERCQSDPKAQAVAECLCPC